MGPFEAVVVFTISWWLVFLPILSAGTTSQAEHGTTEPGTDPAAPVAAGLPRKIMIATAAAAAITLTAWIGGRLGWFDQLIGPR